MIVRRRFAIFSLLLGWVCTHGAIWDAVQVFAWGKMFTGYASQMSVAAALRETFDPAKPCHLCLGVAAAKQAAKQQLPQAVERATEKFVLALEVPASLTFENASAPWPVALSSVAPSRSDPVPLPPPRV